ncbi:peptidase family M50 [Ruminiclostridium hungatei]|uniref:Peptidase family M50 n=1 Tax=Ruminiclostridium hungatei TaxID=48256 RepID=A0A1V4SJG9_RUMHU|nr:site-2 protease family protein [Ruminiclostridium hungatei]OPX43646.1 peptidase family M50 [Ruminiclostridium hungatei]
MFGNFNITEMLMTLPGLLLGFVFHEFAHAKTSDLLGDPTPRSQGRITLDPRAHIDIVGFIVMLIAHFGWAKPVITNPSYYKKPRRDDILVSVAGPFTNFLISVVFMFILKLFVITGAFQANQALWTNIYSVLFITAHVNMVLFVLNMIPFPMFDGYHVISNIFNTWRYRFFNILEQYGMFIFIFLAVSGLLGRILSPIVTFVFKNMFYLILG